MNQSQGEFKLLEGNFTSCNSLCETVNTGTNDSQVESMSIVS